MYIFWSIFPLKLGLMWETVFNSIKTLKKNSKVSLNVLEKKTYFYAEKNLFYITDFLCQIEILQMNKFVKNSLIFVLPGFSIFFLTKLQIPGFTCFC